MKITNSYLDEIKEQIRYIEDKIDLFSIMISDSVLTKHFSKIYINFEEDYDDNRYNPIYYGISIYVKNDSSCNEFEFTRDGYSRDYDFGTNVVNLSEKINIDVDEVGNLIDKFEKFWKDINLKDVNPYIIEYEL